MAVAFVAAYVKGRGFVCPVAAHVTTDGPSNGTICG